MRKPRIRLHPRSRKSSLEVDLKRIAVLLLILCGCTSGTLPKSYAVILDPSLGELSYGVQTALRERLPNAEFMQSVLPADKHEAIVLVRGACPTACGSMPPSMYVYEIFRGEKVARKGRTSALVGDGGVDTHAVSTVAPKTLATKIARDLRRL